MAGASSKKWGPIALGGAAGQVLLIALMLLIAPAFHFQQCPLPATAEAQANAYGYSVMLVTAAIFFGEAFAVFRWAAGRRHRAALVIACWASSLLVALGTVGLGLLQGLNLCGADWLLP